MAYLEISVAGITGTVSSSIDDQVAAGIILDCLKNKAFVSPDKTFQDLTAEERISAIQALARIYVNDIRDSAKEHRAAVLQLALEQAKREEPPSWE